MMYLHDHPEFAGLLRILNEQTGIDEYCLLADERVRAFIGTETYQQHKQLRFPKEDQAIAINANEAFLLSDPGIRQRFADRYNSTRGLYYQGQPAFSDILARIHQYIDLL
ncbi:hypothetical protein [Chitinophaga sp.]|uniref:hypothetical protein n=1 Tax=Chitinophaga sp. TaxID=1869181 RepID=UPI0031CEA8CA